MKNSFLLAGAFLLSACSLLSRNHGDVSSADEIVKLEHKWNDAIRTRDSAALEKLLASDFVLAANGSRHGAVRRATWLSATLRPVAFDTLGSDNISVTMRGDSATATLRTFWRASISGQHVSAASSVSDLWIRRQGRWQVRSRRVIKQERPPRLASAATH